MHAGCVVLVRLSVRQRYRPVLNQRCCRYQACSLIRATIRRLSCLMPFEGQFDSMVGSSRRRDRIMLLSLSVRYLQYVCNSVLLSPATGGGEVKTLHISPREEPSVIHAAHSGTAIGQVPPHWNTVMKFLTCYVSRLIDSEGGILLRQLASGICHKGTLQSAPSHS